MAGIFVISLDFELLWGVHDHATVEDYGERILGAREVIPEILEQFQKYDIHATWATVGMLFAQNKSKLEKYLPKRYPKYQQEKLSNYKYLDEIGNDETVDKYHYGYSIIQKIKEYPGQEIASHTFSHYYCREKGQSVEHFADDLQSAIQIARDSDICITSMVFPRNQVNSEYIEYMRHQGILCYRGEDRNFIYRGKNTMFKRVLRLADVYLGFIRTHCYDTKEMMEDHILNIRASMFLRPYTKQLKWLERLKIYQIKHRMKTAAKQGKIFHLWFHPHNFGKNQAENLQNLEEILIYYLCLKEQYAFESLNMREMAECYL